MKFLSHRQHLCVHCNCTFLELHKFSDWFFHGIEIETIYNVHIVDWRRRMMETRPSIRRQQMWCQHFSKDIRAGYFCHRDETNIYPEHSSCIKAVRDFQPVASSRNCGASDLWSRDRGFNSRSACRQLVIIGGPWMGKLSPFNQPLRTTITITPRDAWLFGRLGWLFAFRRRV